jgi:hypothetical protein
MRCNRRFFAQPLACFQFLIFFKFTNTCFALSHRLIDHSGFPCRRLSPARLFKCNYPFFQFANGVLQILNVLFH